MSSIWLTVAICCSSLHLDFAMNKYKLRYCLQLISWLGLLLFTPGCISVEDAPVARGPTPRYEPLTTDWILLRSPVLAYPDGNRLLEPIVVDYLYDEIGLNEEFTLEPETLGFRFANDVGALKLQLREISLNFVQLQIVADKRHDGRFHYRETDELLEVQTSACVRAYTLILDTSYQYCFTLSQSGDLLVLDYALERIG